MGIIRKRLSGTSERPESSSQGPRNPWVETDQVERDDAVLEVVDEQDSSAEVAASDRRPLAPQPGLVTLAEGGRRLPRVTVTDADAARVWWVGVHGGAGETTLERLLPDSRAAGHAWPLRPGVRRAAMGPAVVLVARTDARGLRAAQAAAAEWASGDVPVTLLGLVLVADAPGRPPRALRELAHLVEGGVPMTWRVPWCEPWRLGEEVEIDSAPRAVRDLTAAVAAAAPRAPEAPGTSEVMASGDESTTERQEGGAHA